MARRNTARATAPTARQTEIWTDEVPTVDERLAESDVDELRGCIGDVVNYLMPPAGDDTPDIVHSNDIRAARVRLQDGLRLLEDWVSRIGRLDRETDALMAHAEALQEACSDLAERATEAEEIRDAIERYPGTAPDVWVDALRIARSGGNVRDMWCGGKS